MTGSVTNDSSITGETGAISLHRCAVNIPSVVVVGVVVDVVVVGVVVEAESQKNKHFTPALLRY